MNQTQPTEADKQLMQEIKRDNRFDFTIVFMPPKFQETINSIVDQCMNLYYARKQQEGKWVFPLNKDRDEWTYDYAFLEKATETINNSDIDSSLSMEDVENVLRFVSNYTVPSALPAAVKERGHSGGSFKERVLAMLRENQLACTNLTEEDAARTAQDITNELHEDYIAIIESMGEDASTRSAGQSAEMDYPTLLKIFKAVTLMDLSDCYFEQGAPGDEEMWVNALRSGVVIDAIAFDGNLFSMMNNDVSWNYLNPMRDAFAIWLNDTQPLPVDAGTVPVDFIEYVNNARLDFVTVVKAAERSLTLSTATDSLLIAYDQMVDKLKPVDAVSDAVAYNRFLDMQYYMEYCQRNDYVTPQYWIENLKHY